IELLAEDINRQMSLSRDYYELHEAYNSRVYLLSVAGCSVNPKKANRLDLKEPIILLQVDKVRNSLTVRFDSAVGYMKIEDEENENIKFELILENASWEYSGQVRRIDIQKYANDIEVPPKIANSLKLDHFTETIRDIGTERSVLKHSPSDQLSVLYRQWPIEIEKVDNEIYAEIHSRLVLGLGCIALILTGIALGIQFRGGHMLSAFGASAVPGGVLMTFILSGKALTTNSATDAMTGVTVMWAGLLVLVILTIWVYRKLLST
ncbi:MAG: LptF/LptG family permease, partial [Planctomycetes bacterium]|nr:LptF/LptG family permease [Planctomycetota bacterium]